MDRHGVCALRRYSYIASRLGRAPLLTLTPSGSRLDAMEAYAGRPLQNVVRRPSPELLPDELASESSGGGRPSRGGL